MAFIIFSLRVTNQFHFNIIKYYMHSGHFAYVAASFASFHLYVSTPYTVFSWRSPVCLRWHRSSVNFDALSYFPVHLVSGTKC